MFHAIGPAWELHAVRFELRAPRTRPVFHPMLGDGALAVATGVVVAILAALLSAQTRLLVLSLALTAGGAGGLAWHARHRLAGVVAGLVRLAGQAVGAARLRLRAAPAR